jgi:hypothetical protein
MVGLTPRQTYSQGKSPRVHWLGGWVGNTPGLDVSEKRKNSLHLPGFLSRIVQTISGLIRYTICNCYTYLMAKLLPTWQSVRNPAHWETNWTHYQCKDTTTTPSTLTLGNRSVCSFTYLLNEKSSLYVSIICHKFHVMTSEHESAIGSRFSLTIKCAFSFNYHNIKFKNEGQR